MRGMGRIAGLGAAALLMAAGILVAGPGGTASASSADCSGGANGFTDIPNTLTGTAVGGAAASNAFGDHGTYYLETGTVGGRQMGWGYLTTHGGEYTQADLWMDVSNDGGATWIQCGPFSTYMGGTLTTAAYPTSASPSRRFRACASISGTGGGIDCLGWW